MKFLRKFYRWSLIIIIPLLMGSYIRGCSGLFDILGLSLLFCHNSINIDYNDETYYVFGEFNTSGIIIVADSGHIFKTNIYAEGCFSTLGPQKSNTLNNLNRIDYFANLSLLIIVGDSGAIVREDEPANANTWELVNSPTYNNLNGLCRSGNSIFAAGDAGTVIKSDDTGLTWELLNFPFNVDLRDCSSPADGEVICVGASSFAAYKTTDYGDTWVQIFFGDVYLASIKSELGSGFQRVYYFDNNISYIVGTGLVFRTNDNWNTYEFQDPGTSENLNDVFFVAADTGVIIGNNGTARFTSDGGQNWFEDPDVTAALNGTTLKRIKKQADDFGLVVGEGGLSIAFARDSTAFTPVEDEQQVVTEYSLSQNYPNPFNPTTKINYSIPQFGLVSIKVYDLLGNEIATLVNEEKPVGVYEVEFSAIGGSASGGNAYSLPSGIYFYKLEAGSFVEAKKMILLK